MNTAVQVVLQGPVVRLIRPLPRHKSLCLAGVLWASGVEGQTPEIRR